MVYTTTLLSHRLNIVVSTNSSKNSSKSPNKPDADKQRKALKYVMHQTMDMLQILQRENKNKYVFNFVVPR